MSRIGRPWPTPTVTALYTLALGSYGSLVRPGDKYSNDIPPHAAAVRRAGQGGGLSAHRSRRTCMELSGICKGRLLRAGDHQTGQYYSSDFNRSPPAIGSLGHTSPPAYPIGNGATELEGAIGKSKRGRRRQWRGKAGRVSCWVVRPGQVSLCSYITSAARPAVP